MIGAVVQARMSSRRFPGKVLRPLAGKPMLAWVIERLRQATRLDGIVVATSRDSSDDAIGRWAQGLRCYRGSLDNVASRVITAGRLNDFTAIVRVSGDSPLLDPQLIDMAIERYQHSLADVVTNVHPRTCPIGQSVEVIRLGALERAMDDMDAHDCEHVTPALYRGDFRIDNFDLGEDLSGSSFAVDTPEDAQRIEALIARMTRPHWQYGVRELLAL